MVSAGAGHTEAVSMLSSAFDQHQWADENLGWNLGERIYQNGEITMEESFVGGSQEAIQYAEALFGWGELEQSKRLELQIE